MSRPLFALVFLSIVIFTANSWGVPVFILDEAKNASCAYEMLASGDYVVPTFNGELRTDKPPLHYYFMMLGYSMFGKSEFSARLFSSIAGITTILGIYFFTKKYISAQAGFISGIILLSALMVAMEFHLAVPDPYLISLVFLGCLFLFDGFQNRSNSLYIGYLLLGFGVLAKGPIAIVLPALGVLIFLIISRQLKWPAIWAVRPFSGFVIILVVAVPWFYLVHLKTDGVWTEGFFLKHNVSRFTETMEGHGGFPMASVVIAFAVLLPFSVFVPQSVKYVFKEDNVYLKFCMASGFSVIVFFLFSQTILPNYIIPAIPFLAVIVGAWLSSEDSTYASARVSLLILLIISIAIPVVACFVLAQDKVLNQMSYLAYPLIILPIGIISGWIFGWFKRIKHMVSVIAITYMLTFLMLTYLILPGITAHNPVTASINIVGEKVYSFERFNPAFVFYHGVLKELTVEEIKAKLEHGEKFQIITRKDRLAKLQEIPGLNEVFRYRDLFENHTTIILETNH